MISANFNSELGIFELKYSGNVNLEDILEFIRKHLDNNALLPRKLKILTDARQIKFNFMPDDVSEIGREVKSLISQYTCIWDAFITDSPFETAMTLLYKNVMKGYNHKFKTFITKDAALEWLLHDGKVVS